MERWMQQLKETYSHMVYSRLLHEQDLSTGEHSVLGLNIAASMHPEHWPDRKPDELLNPWVPNLRSTKKDYVNITDPNQNNGYVTQQQKDAIKRAMDYIKMIDGPGNRGLHAYDDIENIRGQGRNWPYGGYGQTSGRTSVQEKHSRMPYSRLLHEGGSLNVGTPGQMGEPMQPAMRPMRPGDDPHQRLAAGREQLRKDWQEKDNYEEQIVRAVTDIFDPHRVIDSVVQGMMPHRYIKNNPFVHQYVDLNGQPKTGQATPAKPTPKSNQQYYEPTRNPNPYGDWDPNKPSNR